MKPDTKTIVLHSVLEANMLMGIMLQTGIPVYKYEVVKYTPDDANMVEPDLDFTYIIEFAAEYLNAVTTLARALDTFTDTVMRIYSMPL